MSAFQRNRVRANVISGVDGFSSLPDITETVKEGDERERV